MSDSFVTGRSANLSRVAHFTGGFIERVNHSTIEFIVKLYRELFIVKFISNYLLLSNDIYTKNDKNISGYPTAKSLEDLDDIYYLQRSMLCYKPRRHYDTNKHMEGINRSSLLIILLLLLLSFLFALICESGNVFFGFIFIIFVLFGIIYIKTDACFDSLISDCHVLEKTDNMT